MTNYRELIVWQKSMDLTTKIYELTSRFPKSEIYALTDQMKRSAVSIPSNIAEGANRKTKKEYVQFLHIASGSNAELQTQLEIGYRVGHYSKEEIKDIYSLTIEINKMIYKMIETLSTNN